MFRLPCSCSHLVVENHQEFLLMTTSYSVSQNVNHFQDVFKMFQTIVLYLVLTQQCMNFEEQYKEFTAFQR